jgi:CDP-paratose 2-epimerase
MRLLITGVCGFVGRPLAIGFREQIPGLELLGLDNFVRPGSEHNRADLAARGVRFFPADIRSASDIEALPA